MTIETNEEFVDHCKQATESLVYIADYVGDDGTEELTGLESISMLLALSSVTYLGNQLDDDSGDSDFRVDDTLR